MQGSPTVSAKAVLTEDLTPNPQTLYAVYDLQVCPVTFDVIGFLVLAAHEAQERGLPNLHILIALPDDFSQKREAQEKSLKQLHQRIEHILLQSIDCLNPAPTYSFIQSRAALQTLYRQLPNLHPQNYCPATPSSHYGDALLIQALRSGKQVPKLHAPSTAKQAALEFLKIHIPSGKQPLSITLRQSNYSISRNSDLATWLQFASSLKDSPYYPVFIPDIEATQTLPSSADYAIFQDAAEDLRIRLALYEACPKNFTINTGPSILLWLGNALPYSYFKVTDESHIPTQTRWKIQTGLEPLDHWPNASSEQKMFWTDDTLPALQTALTPPSSIQEAKQRLASIQDPARKLAVLTSILGFFNNPELQLERIELLDQLDRHTEAFYAFQNEAQKEALPAIYQRSLFKAGDPKSILKALQRKAPMSSGPVLIFGASQAGLQALAATQDKSEVLALLDNAPQKHGTQIEGLPVLSPQEISQYPQARIIIASSYAREILVQLVKELNVAPERISIFEIQ